MAPSEVAGGVVAVMTMRSLSCPMPSSVSSLGLFSWSLRAYLTRLTVLCMLGGPCPCFVCVVRPTQLCLFINLVGQCSASSRYSLCLLAGRFCHRSLCACKFSCCSRSPGRMRGGKLVVAARSCVCVCVDVAVAVAGPTTSGACTCSR
uniref:Uncharacterized protein n=1 Tax=Schistocephalus solidus TaxID=70667 RepID=A0A0V0J235_SCHSO